MLVQKVDIKELILARFKLLFSNLQMKMFNNWNVHISELLYKEQLKHIRFQNKDGSLSFKTPMNIYKGYYTY